MLSSLRGTQTGYDSKQSSTEEGYTESELGKAGSCCTWAELWEIRSDRRFCHSKSDSIVCVIKRSQIRVMGELDTVYGLWVYGEWQSRCAGWGSRCVNQT